MRILFTGATGVIGDEAVPLLVAAGHDVDAVVRTDDQRRRLAARGANPVSVDLFDPRAVAAAVSRVDAVVHMATAIPPQSEMTKRSSWHPNDRLRVEATRLLVEAALDARVERFAQQSVSLVYADGGDRWLEETAAVAPVWHVLDSALTAESEVSRLSATGRAGVVLRLSSLYGSGRTSTEHLDAIANRRLPRVGRGENFLSRVHVGDAASSIVAAIDAPAGTWSRPHLPEQRRLRPRCGSESSGGRCRHCGCPRARASRGVGRSGGSTSQPLLAGAAHDDRLAFHVDDGG